MERDDQGGTPQEAGDRSRGRGLVLSEEQLKRRRLRNYAIGLAVLLFIVLIYVVTLVRLGHGAGPSPS
jgi:hypothetical protein